PGHPHAPACCATPSSPPCSMRAWTCGTSRSPPATPTRAPRCATTGPARTSTGTRTTSSPPTWPPGPERRPASPADRNQEDIGGVGTVPETTPGEDPHTVADLADYLDL